jgi:hypothetical protein
VNLSGTFLPSSSPRPGTRARAELWQRRKANEEEEEAIRNHTFAFNYVFTTRLACLLIIALKRSPRVASCSRMLLAVMISCTVAALRLAPCIFMKQFLHRHSSSSAPEKLNTMFLCLAICRHELSALNVLLFRNFAAAAAAAAAPCLFRYY